MAECRVLFVKRGSPCDVRANAGAADRRRARQQGLKIIEIAMEAAVWARGWTLGSVSDGLGFQERGELSLSGLVRLLQR